MVLVLAAQQFSAFRRKKQNDDDEEEEEGAVSQADIMKTSYSFILINATW